MKRPVPPVQQRLEVGNRAGAADIAFFKTMTTDKLYQRIDLYVNLHTEFNLARYQTTLFVEFRFRKNRTTHDKTRRY